MPTYSHIAHAIQDFTKTISDDSIITLDHILFLMVRYRNYIIANTTKELTEQSYQTVCADMELSNNNNTCMDISEIVSTNTLPALMNKGNVTVMPPAGMNVSYRYQYVNYEKYQFVGFNKYFRAFVYVTIGPDGKLHAKSRTNGFEYLTRLRVNAIFEDIESASLASCDDSCNTDESNCSLEDKEFPLDDELVPALMQACVKDIIGAAWQPRDDENNANDELAMLAQILNRYTNNAAKRMLGSRGNEEESK